MADLTNKREQSGVCSGYAERRGRRNSVDLCKTDLDKIIRYLRDAMEIYAASSQSKMADRARLIGKLIIKLNQIQNPNDKK